MTEWVFKRIIAVGDERERDNFNQVFHFNFSFSLFFFFASFIFTTRWFYWIYRMRLYVCHRRARSDGKSE